MPDTHVKTEVTVTLALDSCVFCSRGKLQQEIIRSNDLCTSLVSRPWFRSGQCLVIPNRHIVTVEELEPHESSAIMAELGRLGALLNEGFGSGIMQKYQPLQRENGIKVNHLHFHIIPRHEHEHGLFPVPEPNDFAGFSHPTDEEVAALVQKLR